MRIETDVAADRVARHTRWYGPKAVIVAPEHSDAAPAAAPASAGHTTEFRYKPALDGLRAIAVLSVLAYHYGANWATGGFLGVDMYAAVSPAGPAPMITGARGVSGAAGASEAGAGALVTV